MIRFNLIGSCSSVLSLKFVEFIQRLKFVMAGLDPATQRDRVCGRKNVFFARGRALAGWPGQARP